MSQVSRARDIRLGRKVAVKIRHQRLRQINQQTGTSALESSLAPIHD
ncbi:MAG: hypothetical protein DMG25_07475 [Acidobacteria bacterium]|nr:MAG: hypothetical protein DMG25_07475 [Acidobacteriota bacterium]